MGAQGTTTLDFGAGATDKYLDITGQAGILAGSVVSADLLVADSTNNKAEDHALVNAKVRAGAITAGVGLRVRSFSFDAGFQPMAVLGESFRLSVGWRF